MTATSPWFAVAERLVRPTEDPAADDLRRVRAALDRALGDAGGRPVLAATAGPRHRRRRRSRGARGSSGRARRGPARRDRSRRRSPPPRSARTTTPATPAAHSTVRVGIVSSAPSASRTRTCCSSMSMTRVLVRTSTPSRSSCLRAEAERSGGIGRQHPVHRLDEDDLRVRRTDGPEVALERVAGDLAERAGELDPGRAAADEHERHPLAPPVRVGLAFGGLERDEDPRRISVASSMVLRPGASVAHSG